MNYTFQKHYIRFYSEIFSKKKKEKEKKSFYYERTIFGFICMSSWQINICHK